VLARELFGLASLHLGDFVRVNTRDPDPLVVHEEHDARGVCLIVVKHGPENVDHELTCRVVVIMNEDFVESRTLDLFPSLRLGDHVGFVVGFVRHSSSPMGARNSAKSQRA
jgi:hypothetical protein